MESGPYAHARTRRPTREAEGCEARREMEHGGKGAAPSSTRFPPAPRDDDDDEDDDETTRRRRTTIAIADARGAKAADRSR